MSFLTATNTECIYNMPAYSGVDITVSTASQFITPNSGGTVPAAYLPPPFSIWQPSTILGKGFHITFAGTYDTGGATNVTFNYLIDTSVGTAGTPGIIASTGALAWGSNAAGGFYGFLDITFTAVSATTNNLSGFANGMIFAGTANNAAAANATAIAMLGNKSSSGAQTSAFTTWAGATANYFEMNITASAAPTHFQLEQHSIYGIN